MKNRNISFRALALLLVLLMVSASIVVLPASALGLDEVPPEDFVWELDFSKMQSIVDNQGSTEYSLHLTANGGTQAGFPLHLVQKDGRDCLAIEKGNATYFIHDDNNVLANYSTFFIEANMYFEQFPTMTDSDSNHPNDYPLSFLTWMTKATPTTQNFRFNSIRVDSEGYLCKKANSSSRTEAKLPLKEWFNIRFAISPSTGTAEVFLNGQSVTSYKLEGKITSLADSMVRFFDTRYETSVYFSDLSVYTASDYRIGLVSESAADYVGYQTTKIREDGTFDLRVLSGLESNVFGYTGYEVIALWAEKKEFATQEYSAKSNVLYEAVRGTDKNGNTVTVSAEELGVSYLSAIAARNIPTNKGNMELVVRPYAMSNGARRYGNATILLYTGQQENGYPILTTVENSTSYTAYPSADTHVTLNVLNDTTTKNGDAETLSIKNNGTMGTTTRYPYIKFSFTDVGIERILNSSRIYLKVRAKTGRTLTAEEEEQGGILLDVYGTETAWEEKTLNYNTAKDQAMELEFVGSTRYNQGEAFTLDVTDYVQAYAENGAVSFRLENVDDDGGSGVLSFYSSESEYSPCLIVVSQMYGHDVDLNKMNNLGYEPWGYAEKIVDEWVNGGYDEVYGRGTFETIDLEKVDNTYANGDYSIKSDWKSSTPTASWNKRVYARAISTLTGFTSTAKSEYDIYGGVTNSGIKGEATGYFHMEKHGVRNYIIDPLGNPFFAIGMNTVELGATTNQDEAALNKYGTAENFYQSISEELRSYGINTIWGGEWQELIKTGNLSTAGGIGAISRYMSNLGLSVSTGGSAAYLHNNTMNVFDPDFVTHVRERVATVVAPYADNPYIIGWYSDNEIPSQADMLECYLTIDPNEPVNAFSYATAWTFLIARTGKSNPSVDDITAELSEEFKAFVYDRYYKVITTELKKVAPNHMYMGNRIHSENKSSEGYLRVAGKYVDLLTVNLYGGLEPQIDTIKTMYKYSGVPFIVTEFFAKGDDAIDMNGYSLGNQTNAGWIVRTQEDRAIHCENYTLLLLESQTCVGWTWYRFRDNDQTIYQDAEGNLYRAYDYKDKKIYGYVNVETGELIDPAITMNLTVYYKGEGDTSNLGSNKGVYDNQMDPYVELLSAFQRVSDNLFDLINYFDAKNAK